MQALVITALTGPNSLAVQTVPDPILKPGQTLIRVATGGLNFADFMTAKGGYPGTPPPPLIAGREFAGVELAANNENTGRRVMGYAQWAAFAEKTTAYPNMLWPIPDHWTNEQAAAFPVNYFTAYLAYWQAGMTVWEQEPVWGRAPREPALSEAEGSERSAASQSNPGAPFLASFARSGDFPSAQQAPRTPRVLIHAVAGGVGTAAVQIGHLLGIEM